MADRIHKTRVFTTAMQDLIFEIFCHRHFDCKGPPNLCEVFKALETFSFLLDPVDMSSSQPLDFAT